MVDSPEDRSRPGGLLLPLVAHVILATLPLVAILSIHYRDPVLYVYLVDEDYLAEYATFLAWLAAACAFGALAWKRLGAARILPALLALAALFVAGEEISWGQRVLGFESPEYFQRTNRHGETNLHNLVTQPAYGLLGALLLAGAVLPALVSRRFERARSIFRSTGVPTAPVWIWPYFAVGAFLLCGQPVVKWDELGELFSGLALGALAFDILLTELRPGASTRATSRSAATRSAAAVAVLGIAVWGLSALLVTSHRGERPVDIRFASFAAYQYPHYRLWEQAGTLFDHLDEKPELAYPGQRLDHALVLQALGREDEAGRKLQQVLAETGRTLRQRPRGAGPLRVRGRAMRALGRRDEAERLFERAIEVDRELLASPPDPGLGFLARWSLAKTLFIQGDRLAAGAEYEQALPLAPNEAIRLQMQLWMLWEGRRMDALGE